MDITLNQVKMEDPTGSQGKQQVNNGQNTQLPLTEDSMAKIQQQLHDLNQKLNAISVEQNGMREHLYGDEGILKVVTQFGFVANDIPTVKEDSVWMKREICLMKSIIAKQGDQISTLQAKVTDLTARSMQDNVLLHNVPENPDENIQDVFNELLSKIGLNPASVNVEKIHRIGAKLSSRPRLIVTKLSSHKMKESILQAAKDKLPKGRDKVFITPQTPTESLEIRKNLYNVADHIKERDPFSKCIVKAGRLFVNNTPYQPALPTPTTKEVLSMSRRDTEDLTNNIQVFAGKPVIRKGNRFQGFAVPIKNMDDARNAYRTIMLYPDNQAANHVVACASLYSPFSGKLDQHWEDNYEWGAGKALAASLVQRSVKNIAIFVARHYACNLSGERFDAIKDAANNAIEQYVASLNPTSVGMLTQ